MSQEGDGPQLEDGYTRIANELMESILGFGFSQRQYSVVFAVIRKTYGYGKKQDDMSAAQIGQLCNMERNHVTEVIGQLAELKVLTRATGTYGLVLGINKNYSQWLKPAQKKQRCSPNLGLLKDADSPKSGLPEAVQSKGSPNLGLVPTWDETSPNLGQVDSPNLGHTKENLSKEIQKKRTRRAEISFSQWIEDCRQEQRKPIPDEDPIWSYAKEVRLPVEFIRYCWLEFQRKYANASKGYKNWNQHFANAIRENWYGVWFDKEGAWQLTTRGKQIEKEYLAKRSIDQPGDDGSGGTQKSVDPRFKGAK